MAHNRLKMKFEDIVYEAPLSEVLPVETERTIAASNLENPEEGGEWGWD